MSGPAAIIFDFDGVILDTEQHVYEAWRRQYEQFGVELPMGHWISVLGMPAHARDFHAELEKRLGRTFDRAALKAERIAYVEEQLRDKPARAGICDYIDQAVARGLKLAVASGSTHHWVDAHLKNLGLFEYFGAVICADDTAEHKPGPEPFLAAARAIDAEAARCIAVEDSVNGIRSAKAAGMFAVAYPTAMTRNEDFAAAGADVVAQRLDELPFDQLVAGVG